MNDIALKLFTADGRTVPVFDISLLDGDLASDGGLNTSVLLSLFLNRRAQPDDVLPEGVTDRGGWWPTAYDPDAEIGSRLWLLKNKTITNEVLRDFRVYSEEALAWLVSKGIATSVRAETARVGLTAVQLSIYVQRVIGGDWQGVWTVTLQEA